MRTVLLSGALGLLVVFVLGASALAVDRTWDNEAGDNDWYNPINWDPDNEPDPTWSSRWDDLQVLWGTPATTEDVYVNQSQASITITGPTTSASFGLFVLGNWTSGSYDTKSWVRQGGTMSSQGGVIALVTPSVRHAIMTVEDDGSLWTTNGHNLEVGFGGNGQLLVKNAGRVQSGDLYVGHSGAGTLSVTGGGSIETATGYIGFNDWSVGAVTVSGPDSVWTATGSLYVGGSPFAQGSLLVETGAAVNVLGTVEIASGGTVELAGGRLVTGGVSGDGQIDFTAGTLEITSSDLVIGNGQVLGPSVTLNDDDVINVSGRIVVDVTGSMDNGGGSVGCVEFENTGQTSLSACAGLHAATSVVNRAVLTLDGATISGGGLTNDFGATMSAKGLIDSPFTNHGALHLTGVLSVTGGMVNDGTIEIETGESLAQDVGLDNVGVIEVRGGAILGAGQVVNNPGDIIRGEGTIGCDLDNDGGLIHANGTSTLVLANLLYGNRNGGELRIEDGAGIKVNAAFSNSGSIRLLGADATLAGGNLTNTGMIAGCGRVSNLLTNQGVIEADGGTLELSAIDLYNEGPGRLEAVGGATLLCTQGLAVNAGQIVLRGGEFENNGHPLTNTGSIVGNGTLSAGQLTNDNYIGVGLGQLDLIGPVVNNGSIYTHDGSRAVFYGQVSGGGDFPGTGEVVFLAGYSPGGSTSVIHFEGDVVFGPAGSLEIEIGGAGTGDYDRLIISGRTTLGGSLDLSLVDGYVPPLGQTLEIITAGEITGLFGATFGLDIGNGLEWQVVYSEDSVVLQVVPEPATLSLLVLGAVALIRCRRK